MKWEEAIIKVLAETGTKMHIKVITDEIFAKEYRTNPNQQKITYLYQIANELGINIKIDVIKI